MSTVIKTLLGFIDTAEKNRKYPEATAAAKRAAVRLFEPELNDEERESLDTFKAHFDQIAQNVLNKNKSKMKLESLVTYRNRLSGLVSEYEKYGIDPMKMANWNRPVRKVSAQKRTEGGNRQDEPTQEIEKYKEIDMSRFELPLRTGVKAIILVPSDITREEVGKIRKYIDFLESISGTSFTNKKG
jgi:hypothetical protein